MQRKYKKSAFTLIEVLIVIMILGMMLGATYAPYSHYQKKALLKQGKKEIVQSIYEARNLAINGLERSGVNVSVAVLMDNTTDDSKKKLYYYSYPHETDTPTITLSSLDSSRLIKTKDLPRGVELEKIQGQDKFMFLYDSIYGNGKYYSGTSDVLNLITDSKVDINISFKGATTPTLQGNVDYFTRTYIANY